MDFLIAKDNLHRCRFAEDPAPELEPGQARLRVERFGLSANNVTYAMFGEAMSYWSFFPSTWRAMRTCAAPSTVASAMP